MAVPEPVLTARDLHRPGALGTEFTHELGIRACPLLRGECGSRLTDWHLPCPPSRALRVSPATRARGARLSQLHSCAAHRVCWSWRDRQSPRPGAEAWPEAWTRGTGVFPGRVRARRRGGGTPQCPAAGGDGLTVSGRAEGVSPLPPATPSWPKPGVASVPRGAHWEGGRSPGPFSRLHFHFGWKPWAGQPPGRNPGGGAQCPWPSVWRTAGREELQHPGGRGL